ncbi:pyridoxal phosphate-dependent aminotransferase [Halobacteriovorax sp.]|uniref:pyridoxal phosphate-dependent aminotransferase n=1 Tax=Halobacteriovorax sp. TaxID=2020862 RepID=UPI003AF2FB02
MKRKTQPILNPNVLKLKESATLAINMRARKAKADGLDICHLGFGQSPFHVHEKIQSELANNSHQKDYLPTRGLPKLCESIANYYNQKFEYNLDEDRILVGPGSKELIFQALYVLEGPVIVPAPSWVSYGPQLNIKGREIDPVITSVDNSYKLTASELEEACQRHIDEKQKILIFNSPSNPTGAVYNKEEIEELTRVCRKHNVIVIADEIYSLINFSGSKFASFHQIYPEGTLISSGLSKSHAAGGYRLGFLYAPEGMESVIKCLSAMISETFSAVSAPIQYAAVKAYSIDNDIDNYIRTCTRVHEVCGNYLHDRFKKMGLSCSHPKGAFYLFPDFGSFKEKLKSKNIHNDVELSEFIFENYNVALLPGSDFYFPKDAMAVRVASVDYQGENVYKEASLKDSDSLDYSFVEANCPQLKKACDRLEEFLNTL